MPHLGIGWQANHFGRRLLGDSLGCSKVLRACLLCGCLRARQCQSGSAAVCAEGVLLASKPEGLAYTAAHATAEGACIVSSAGLRCLRTGAAAPPVCPKGLWQLEHMHMQPAHLKQQVVEATGEAVQLQEGCEQARQAAGELGGCGITIQLLRVQANQRRCACTGRVQWEQLGGHSNLVRMVPQFLFPSCCWQQTQHWRSTAFQLLALIMPASSW